MRLPPRLLLVLLVPILAGPALGSLHDRKMLTVEGRTIDPEGFPIEKVKVRLHGARQSSVVSNLDGQFTLKIPIGTPNDLRRGTLRVFMTAERKGYRFAIPGGEERLGLEIGLEAASGGLGRCFARSNDERVAASAARIVALEGDAIGLVVVNFVGVKGEPTANATWPKVDHVAHAALPFALEGPVRGLPPGTGVPDLKSERSRSAWSVLREGSSSKSSEPPADQDVKRRATALADSTAAGVLGYARASAVGDSSMEKWRDARWQPQSLSETAGTAPAPAAKAAGTAKAPAASAARSDPTSAKEGRASTSSGGGAVVPLTAAEIAAERERLDRSLPPAPSPSPAPASTSGPVITPQPSGSAGRGRSRPLVIRNAAPGTRANADSCECHVDGTVEVQTVVPIRGPQRIEISLQWYPQLRDTVELFMGPPRPFKLPPGPCGPQRLRVRVLTDGRFDIVSPEALSGFRCEGGRSYQPRLVLVTR